jgi:phosphatidylinositol alpha-1,6-mannosyltransferase
VAGSGGGVDEAVVHLKTGIVVDVDHPQEVLDSVIRLLSHPDEARALGVMGRKRVLEEFTWEKQLARLG